MVPLTRGPTPRVLTERAAGWTQDFVAERQKKPELRPRGERYGHREVRAELRRMSHRKCFYCERALAESEEEVDHSIEVAERPNLAFDWNNLYLSCGPCNDKAPNTRIPVASCVDPCASGVRPESDLLFDGEFITARDNSTRGQATIDKYDLTRPELTQARVTALNGFLLALLAVKDRMIAEARKTLTDDERALLRAYASPTRPFSMMMAAYVERLGL